MATIVCFHAHPDDESISTGGVMAKAAEAGHRVVLVVATRGEMGEVPEGFLDAGEQLGIRRIGEAMASAKVLGADRVEFLGYVDSGMIGTDTNDAPYCFWKADVELAANRLAAILREENADILTVYDDNGGYGHPDHIQVHRVGLRAAEMAGVPRVFEATMNRDEMRRGFEEIASTLTTEEMAELPNMDDGPKFGVEEHRLTHSIDVKKYTDTKRASMRCHPSQISETDFFMTISEEQFDRAFGTEWFIEHGRTRASGAPFIDDLFADLP